MAKLEETIGLWFSRRSALIGLSIGLLLFLALFLLIPLRRSSPVVGTVAGYGYGISCYGQSEEWVSVDLPNANVHASWLGGTHCPTGSLVTLNATSGLTGASWSAQPGSCRPA